MRALIKFIWFSKGISKSELHFPAVSEWSFDIWYVAPLPLFNLQLSTGMSMVFYLARLSLSRALKPWLQVPQRSPLDFQTTRANGATCLYVHFTSLCRCTWKVGRVVPSNSEVCLDSMIDHDEFSLTFTFACSTPECCLRTDRIFFGLRTSHRFNQSNWKQRRTSKSISSLMNYNCFHHGAMWLEFFSDNFIYAQICTR